MNKPLSVAKYEFENNLVDLVNTSGLPLCVAEYVLSDMLGNIRAAAKQQLEKDLEAYKASIMQGMVNGIVPDEETV